MNLVLYCKYEVSIELKINFTVLTVNLFRSEGYKTTMALQLD
jgi:hypothetical protein